MRRGLSVRSEVRCRALSRRHPSRRRYVLSHTRKAFSFYLKLIFMVFFFIYSALFRSSRRNRNEASVVLKYRTSATFPRKWIVSRFRQTKATMITRPLLKSVPVTMSGPSLKKMEMEMKEGMTTMGTPSLTLRLTALTVYHGQFPSHLRIPRAALALSPAR